MSAAQTLHTPYENLKTLSEQGIELNKQTKLQFSLLEGENALMVKVSNSSTKQEYSFKVHAAEQNAALLVKEYYTLQRLAAAKDKNKIVQSHAREEEVAGQIRQMKELFKPFINEAESVTKLAANESLNDKITALLSIKPDELAGFSSSIFESNTEIGKLRDIKRGTQRVHFTKDGVTLQVRAGKRTEIFVEMESGNNAAATGANAKATKLHARFGVELEKGLSPEETAKIVQKLLLELKDIKDVNTLTTSLNPKESNSPAFLKKLLEHGSISRLENISLSGVNISQANSAEKLIIINAKVVDSYLELGGAFRAENLQVEGKSHLLLHSAGSLLANCKFGSDVILTARNTAGASGLNGAVLLGETEFHCNAYHCDFRNLYLRGVAPKWSNYKGFIYDEKYVDPSIKNLGRILTKKEFAKELARMDAGFPDREAYVARVLELCPGFTFEYGKREETGTDGRVVQLDNKEHLIFHSPGRDKTVEVFLPEGYDSEEKRRDPLGRIKLRYSIPEINEWNKEQGAISLQCALHDTISWLNWRKNTVDPDPNTVGAGQVPTNYPKPEDDQKA